MTEIKNILLIGRTGTGKSTLANVLTNKNGNFTKVFKESEGSTSETKHYQRELVDVNGKKYGIVDTIGLSDTKLKPNEVYSRLAEAIKEFFEQDGINRVIFTTDGRFTKEEITAFASLQLALFDDEIIKHCTIVRTNFPEFNDEDKCDKDIRDLLNENPKLEDLIKSIGPKNIIHTDAHDYTGWEEDWKKLNQRLWNYLKGFEEDKYMPKGIENLNKKINQVLAGEQKKQKDLQDRIDELNEEVKKAATEKAKLEKELEDKKFEEKERKRLEKELEEANKKIEKVQKENEKNKKEKERLDVGVNKQQGEILEKHGNDSLSTFVETYTNTISKGVEIGGKVMPIGGGFLGAAITLIAGLPFLGAQLYKFLFWN